MVSNLSPTPFGRLVALPVLGYGLVVAVGDPALARQVFAAKPDVLLGGAGVGPGGSDLRQPFDVRPGGT